MPDGCDANDCTEEATVVWEWTVGEQTLVRHYCDDHAAALLEAITEEADRA